MSALDLFTYEGQQVRTVVVDGSPWFVSADVLTVLDLNRSSVATLDDDERGVHSVDTPSGAQQMSVLNEPGLYSLILRSRKPEAKPFKRWITHEVLPAVRKTGSYGQTNVDQIPRATLAQMILDSEAEKVAAIERAEQSEAEVIQLSPKARAWEVTASSSDDMTVTDAAKAISRSGQTIGPRRFYEWMREQGWVFRNQRDRWTASQRHIDNGRLTHKVQNYTDRHTGEVHLTHTVYVTPKGVEDAIARLAPSTEVAR